MNSLIKNLKPQRENQKQKEYNQESESLHELTLDKKPARKPKSKRSAGGLSVEQLKQFPGLEKLSDEKAREVIKSLEAFAQLTFNQFTSLYGHP